MPGLKYDSLAASEACRRAFERLDTEIKGRLIINEGCSHPCTISNTSPGGARIVLHSPEYVPPRFDLEFTEDEIVITCRKAWQSGADVGAHFISALIVHLNNTHS
ncbi:PilZ domain-containing protein [Parvularcula flava]|uniref:PilZ domain-containing protein n=1 Tax=Aquisalinus luteolus TaxID=1566827 RepID=A0A8J3A8R9_9PROT|nr:PilZ domain-containing protein [Aquisalinus luteolus]NHK28344.1 PilZ domain-containing protein [Aquisalinus luteolus]GGH98193.1 hypothetical protein GCM10011355_21210 [Aquisalinus luteolus]